VSGTLFSYLFSVLGTVYDERSGMKKWLVCSMMIVLLAGCSGEFKTSLLNGIDKAQPIITQVRADVNALPVDANNAQNVTAAGKIVLETAPAVGAINGTAGVIAVAIGGILTALGVAMGTAAKKPATPPVPPVEPAKKEGV
jgi:hypothetical protein